MELTKVKQHQCEDQGSNTMIECPQFMTMYSLWINTVLSFVILEDLDTDDGK